MRAANAQTRTIHDFQQSNSTTNAFIGGTQKAWMTGQAPKSTRDPSTPKVSRSKARDQASIMLHSTPEAYRAVEDSDLSGKVFGPNLDRGSYPGQRPGQGGANNHANGSSISLPAGSTSQVLSLPAFEKSPYIQPAIPMDASTNAENVLPSPSPSLEARENGVNVVDLEEERDPPEVSEVSPVEAPRATLEELVKRCGGVDQLEKMLKEAGKSNYGPSQIAASAVSQGLPSARPSSGPRPQGRSQPDHNAATSSITNKRPHEIPEEPRKRLQSLPGSSSEKSIALPFATTVLSNQNRHSSAAVSPSGFEMYPFVQALAQRAQVVENMPNREGSHVERPRLGLLRDACEKSDYFYLVLHQLFCFDHQVRKSHRHIPSLNELHRKGLDVVAFLLVSNKAMADGAVAWFSIFPLPWGDALLNKPEFASAHAKVLRCLENMAKFWNGMRAQSTKRKYPPLVDELIVLFNVESFLFQQIIFRAILRDIWSGKLDDCFQAAEDLFSRDYNAVMSRLSTGSTGIELAKHYQWAIIKEYQQILECHWQHTLAGPAANTVALVQQHNPTCQATANHCSINRQNCQPGQNKNTQSSLTLDTHTAQRHNVPAAPHSAPIVIQGNQIYRQGNIQSQSQAFASNTFSPPQFSNFTQSPATAQGFFWPGSSMDSLGQWNNQQQQRERRTSSTASNIPNGPQSTTPIQRTPHTVPSNVSGNAYMHRFQQNIGLQQQSHNGVPSSSIANSPPRPQSEARRSFGNRASETTSTTASPHPFILHSSPALPTSANPTPFIRSYPPLPAPPNPITSALHQAHLRSPTLSYLNINNDPSSITKCYRFIKHVLMPPEELDSKNRHVNWDFNVNKELIDWFARDEPGSHGAPPTRQIVPGSRLCRIRCINLKNKVGMPTQSEWAVADNVWPGSTAVILNGIALDIRKKTHHGKDLPIDVTPYVKAGQNNLSSAVIGFQKDSTSRYAIGVEFIQVVDEQNIKNEIKTLPWREAHKRILDQAKNVDPDIEVIQSQKVLDFTDPFTARIFDVPVRGINCQHNQCFDRDTFLRTRTGKAPGEPCAPDDFRCPICGNDARPQSLMIDEFFMGVRVMLKERGRLDAKAIILGDTGDWEIKEEDEATGESGDGTGRRSARLVAARTASASVVRAARQSVPREVIELDDD